MTDITHAFAEAFAEAAIPKFRQVVKEEIQASKLEDLKEKYLSVDETMQMLKVSRTTLHTWEGHGKIISHLVGGRRLYRYRDIIAAVEKVKKYQRNNSTEKS